MRLLLALALSVGACGAASAFQETPVAPSAGAGAAAASSGKASGSNIVDQAVGGAATQESEEPTVRFSAPESVGSSGGVGAELTVPASKLPGLGGLSILPKKLDFGLELLYGARDRASEDADRASEDLLLRGRVRHKF